jgi:hypothetical protein
MAGKITALVIGLTVAQSSGSACALNPISSDQERCRVSGAEKLPAAVGGAEILCAAIERALSSASPGAQHRVEVRVVSSSSLAATIRAADGRVVSEQKMAVSDAALTRASIDRFATAIGAELAKAGSR